MQVESSEFIFELAQECLRSCVDLVGGSFRVNGFLAQIVAAFVLFLHAVDEEEDEKHSKKEPNSSTSNNS